MFDSKHRAYSEWLVIRCQQGESKAFSALIKLWQSRLLVYATRRLDDKEAARDATQECFVSICKGIDRLTDPAAFPRWAYQILERRCIDAIRRKIREREFISDASPLPDRGRDDNTEHEKSVSNLLRKFDEKIQTIVRLHYIDGLTINEIAIVLGIPAGTVKSRLFHARKALAEQINFDEKEN